MAYAIAAWLLAQIAGLVFPAYGAPPWVLPVFFSLLIMGFVVALLLSWAYEVTPEGIKRTESVPATASITRATGRKLDFVIIAGMALAIVYLVVDNYGLRSRDGTAAAPMIAVLPCANMGDPSNAWFADGIHEEIIHRLAQLRGLSVVARSSVLRYADGNTPIASVAADLDAQAVMECSVRYAGDEFLVTANLIDPATNQSISLVTPEPGDLGDVSQLFATQAQIALGIASAVDARYTPAEQARVEREQTNSPQAYELYLRSTDLGGDAAIDLLRRAIELDSGFAAAHARLARTYAFSLTNTNTAAAVPAAERPGVEARALNHARIAIGIDPDTPDAYVARGLLATANWRWTEAETALKRATEAGQPYSGVAFNVYGILLSVLGRHDEAIALAKRALALDPLDPNAGWYAFHLGYAGRYAEAAAVFERAIEAAPQNALYRLWLAFMEIARGNASAALRSIEAAERLASNGAATPSTGWAYVYARAGRMDHAQRIFTEIERAVADGAVLGAGGWATAYLAIGDEQRALAQLEIAAMKAASHEPDEGLYSLYVLKMNVTNDREVLTRPEFVDVLSRIRGD